MWTAFLLSVQRRHAAEMSQPRTASHKYSHTVHFCRRWQKISPRVKYSVDENIQHAAVSTLHSAHTRSSPSNLTASVSGNAELHIFAIQHEKRFSSSISYKCCFVLIFHWTSWNLLSGCQGCIFSNSNMASLQLHHCPCHLQSKRTAIPGCPWSQRQCNIKTIKAPVWYMSAWILLHCITAREGSYTRSHMGQR